MQTLYRGYGSIKSIGEITSRLKARKILLITGKGSFESSGAAAALNQQLGANDIVRFSDFDVNPRINDARRGIELLQRFAPDLVIGVGGGSVIDMAKLITTLSAQPDDDYQSLVKTSSITRKGTPLVAIPTTAGSGSEATHFAVTYIEGKKFSLAHQFILPDYVIIDPGLTCNLSSYQTAASGMDALCQAVESFWSVNSTEQSRDFARQAIKLILGSLEDAVHGGEGSALARQIMAQGSHSAGKAINITKTTAPHALSYTLTTNYAIPHGHAVALMLGKFFIINELCSDELIDPRGTSFFSEIMHTLYRLFDCRDAHACMHLWYQRMQAIGLETDVRIFGITTQSDYEAILNGVNPGRLSNHPVRLTRSLLGRVFY